MSGTSLDGVDIAIMDGTAVKPDVLFCQTLPYPKNLAQRIRHLTHATHVTLEQLGQLDVEIAQFYAQVVNQSLSTVSLTADHIIAIGCHGQTIRHSPTAAPPYTLQIGDPNTLCTSTNITTVADFRRRDMALGGQGAPLAPAFHQSVFRTSDCDRVIINIGGIANITHLPANPNQPVTGFDTGPGNTLLDYWIHQNLAKPYDNKGRWAASGHAIDDLLQTMLTNETYFSQPPPKSTGTEYFSPEWLQAFSPEHYQAGDVQATLLELSAWTIAQSISQAEIMSDECYVCGGGVHNLSLMQRLQTLLPDCAVHSTAKLGVNPDYVEAIAFAWLAKQTINKQTGNLPSVTHASTTAILGGVFQGNA